MGTSLCAYKLNHKYECLKQTFLISMDTEDF